MQSGKTTIKVLSELQIFDNNLSNTMFTKNIPIQKKDGSRNMNYPYNHWIIENHLNCVNSP